MLMTKKELAALCGGLFLTGAVLGATDAVKESFEGYATGAALTALTGATWTGSASIAEATYAAPTGGYVIQGDTAHAKILSIDDSVMVAPATAIADNTPALVDMMVQAMVPEEALQAPDDAAVQIAVGVDKSATAGKGVLKVYCKPKGADAATWCALKEVDASTWHRVTFVFDYANGFAQVRIDGEPQMTESGYLTASASQTATGAWYKLAKADAKTLTSVEVIGTTGLDDMRIAAGDDAVTAAEVVGKDAAGVDYAWYDKNGVAWDSTKQYDGSGLTLKAKYETGLSPFDGEKFAMKEMKMSGTKATFTVPAMNPPAGYKVSLVYSTTPDFKTVAGSVPVTAGATTVEVEGLAADVTVYYYRLEAKLVVE